VRLINKKIPAIKDSPREWKECLTYMLRIWSCLTRQMID
jgi:hypothetical protein